MPEKLTSLDHFRLLGRSGLRVSPLCLGAMTFGEEWQMGANKEESRKVFDHYAERGGNFIDTANIYNNGTSETFLGEFLAGQRDKFVVATKFTSNMRKGDPNAGGNARKNIHQSIEASLSRLKTDYIDLYLLHAWDGLTPADETIRALDDLVRAGKVLYAGVSDMPAWKVAQSNTLAEVRGLSPYIALQIEYSLVERTVERDLVPMAIDMGLGVTPWSPLGSGILTGKYNQDAANKRAAKSTDDRRLKQDNPKLNDRNLAIAAEVQRVAKEAGRSPAQVALNWLASRPGVTSIIIGARRVDQLEDNLGCLDFTLAPEQLKRLDEVSKIDPGFPHDFLAAPHIVNVIHGGAKISREPR